MAKRNSNDYWVMHREDGRWEVKRAHASRASNVYDTQHQADRRAGHLAKKSGGERVTMGKNGRIRSKDSFGHDPRRRRDQEH